MKEAWTLGVILVINLKFYFMKDFNLHIAETEKSFSLGFVVCSVHRIFVGFPSL